MTAKKEEPSLVDEIGEDVELPAEFPAGAPALKPLLAIRPRSKRAEFKRKYAEAVEIINKVRAAELQTKKMKSGSPERYARELQLWADMDDMYQAIDDALRVAAVDVDAYNGWSDEVDDGDLAATFTVYQQRTQPGEADSSTS